VKATVDDDRCRGHGICWSLCPEVFDLTGDGYAEVLLPEIPPRFEKAVADARDNCPEHAITLT
jgi:ferredoxin